MSLPGPSERGDLLGNPPLDEENLALLLLDFQNYGYDPKGYWASHGPPGWLARGVVSIENTARVLRAARSRGVPVIHVGQVWRAGHPDANLAAPWQASAKDARRTVEGTWDVDFIEPLKPGPGELIVWKHGISALAATDLDRLLHIKRIGMLVLCGGATNWAVEGTAREASDLGYRVVVLRDCCVAMSEEENDYFFRVILPVIGTAATSDEFVQSLGK